MVRTTTRATRMERRRQSTTEEIVEAARSLLRRGEEVTISSVAGTLGLTPPALYRYVPNLRGLNDIIVTSILDDLIERMYSAADRHEDPPARLVSAATAFRQWALNHHAEFRAVFAPSDPLGTVPSPDAPPTTAEIAGGIFASIVAEVMSQIPELDSDVPIAYLATLDRLVHRRTRWWGGLAFPPAAWWQFERAWVRFLGVVSSEVYGFVDPEIVISGDMFVSILSDIGRDLGLGPDINRLVEIAVETADWTNEQDGCEPLHLPERPAE